ncbi:uncharacterized protein V1513DRAFT_459789 [Lipomyces chichibuensis]|uniref:uncharacterized protein n=1 Tax=Lipomyces chichibuensis TaxID=1546026 RepID=UPI0033431871
MSIYLSYKSFQSLEEKAHAIYGGDAKYGYPRVEYSAIDSRVNRYTIPTTLHSASAVGLQQRISESIRDRLNRFDKKHLTSRILPVGESTYSSVDDQGGRSTKTLDAGLQYDNGQRNDLLIIIVAGVSEGYEQLKADIELWLRKFGSGDWFRFPARDGANSLSATGRGFFNGHTWFGTLDIALIVVFKTNVHTNDISSEQYVSDNNIDIEIALLVLINGRGRRRDYLDEQLSVDEKTQPILLETELLLHIVQTAVHKAAIKRYIHSF